jgi:hypothetical protein
MDQRTVDIVRQQLRRTSRSLLQYLLWSFPWTGGEDSAILELEQMAHEEGAACRTLNQLLRKAQEPPPYLGPYADAFMSLNFLSLDGLLPLVVKDQRQAIADLEPAVAAVPEGVARRTLQDLLALKRRHLETAVELGRAHQPVGLRV